MTDADQKLVDEIFKQFTNDIGSELRKNGCIECQSPNCNCKTKEKIPAGKFHVFMEPQTYKCYAVCTLGLMRLSEQYNFWDQLTGPGISQP